MQVLQIFKSNSKYMLTKVVFVTCRERLSHTFLFTVGQAKKHWHSIQEYTKGTTTIHLKEKITRSYIFPCIWNHSGSAISNDLIFLKILKNTPFILNKEHIVFTGEQTHLLVDIDIQQHIPLLLMSFVLTTYG